MPLPGWTPQQRGTDPSWYGGAPADTHGYSSGWGNSSFTKQDTVPVDPFKGMDKNFGQSGRSAFETYGGWLTPFAKQGLMDYIQQDWPMVHDWAHNTLSNLTSGAGIESMANQFGAGSAAQSYDKAGQAANLMALLGGSPRVAQGAADTAVNRGLIDTNDYRTKLLSGEVQEKMIPGLLQILGMNPALMTQEELSNIINKLPVKRRGGLSLGSGLGAATSVAGMLGGLPSIGSGGGGAGLAGLLGGGGAVSGGGGFGGLGQGWGGIGF